MADHLHRRQFLQRSAAVAAAVAAAGTYTAASSAQAKSPNEKLDIAVIGVAGRGKANLAGVAGENIVALCDVDEKNLAAAAGQFPKAQTFVDFRKMLTKMEKQIDAVVVSTPDHTHAPAAVMAMKLGKHCYCEKPLTHTVYEARVAAQAAKERNVATQLGTQIHAGTNYRRVVELIQSGSLGPVREVHVWSQASYLGGDRPTDTPPVPKELHWDLWLGPAAPRPYHPRYMPKKWRAWWDFGSGALGDFGCHLMDLPFWALKLRRPSSVEAEGPPVHAESCSAWLIVRYEYAPREDLPPVKLTWYDGGKQPAQLDQEELLRAMSRPSPASSRQQRKPAKQAPDQESRWKSGVLFVGEKGMLLADYDRHVLLPQARFAGFSPPEPTIPESIGHHAEWINACKTGSPTACNFDYSGPLTEAVLLGAVAYRAGEKLHWDAENFKATNCPRAEQYLQRPYRKGWTL